MSLLFYNARCYRDYEFYLNHFPRPIAASSDALIFHCMWQGVLRTHHELCINSLLVTQSAPFMVYIWLSRADFNINICFRRIFREHKEVVFRIYDPLREASGTPYERCHKLLIDLAPAAASDGFRQLILYKYGGFYFDLDVLFLDDWRPLASCEFFYQWSDRPYGNSAVMHFNKGRCNISALAGRSIAIKSCHPAKLLDFRGVADWVNDVVVMPVFMFDPIWQSHDLGRRINNYCNRFDDFFSLGIKIPFKEFFAGSFGYHWHNRWNTKIADRSIAGYLCKEVACLLKGKGRRSPNIMTIALWRVANAMMDMRSHRAYSRL